MNIQDFKDSLPKLLNNNIVPFVWGRQGIGKTQTVHQYAKDNDLGFIHLHLATQEVGDLVGLLVHRADGTVGHARPEWFPTSGTGVVFLDELNRAHPDVIQAMFSFITSKTIHTHRLPDGWKIVAAGNFGDEFNVTDTSDAAWLSRFCHVKLQPTVEEFTLFADKRGANLVSDFITEHPQMLEAKVTTPDVPVTPDRRAWLEMIAPLDQEAMSDENRFELYSGIVGPTASAALMAYRKSSEKRVRLMQIMNDYPKVQKKIQTLDAPDKVRFDVLSAPLEELLVKLKEDKQLLVSPRCIENLHAFFLDLPLELLAQTVKRLGKLDFKNKDALLNDPELIKHIKR